MCFPREQVTDSGFRSGKSRGRVRMQAWKRFRGRVRMQVREISREGFSPETGAGKFQGIGLSGIRRWEVFKKAFRKGQTMAQTAEFHGDLVTSHRNIYTPSSFARECLLHLQEAGSLRAAKPHTSKRSGLSSYLFFLVVSGSGSLSVSGHDYVLRKGDCVFLDCLNSYSHTTSRNLWELKWVHFNGSQMPGIYRKFLERNSGPVFHSASEALTSQFLALLDNIYDISLSDCYTRDMKLNEALSSLLSLTMEEAWNPQGKLSSAICSDHEGGSASSESSIADVRYYLDLHYAEDLSLDFLAEQFHFNKYYLMRRFRQQYGTTIGNYLIHARIGAAKKLLRFSDISLEEAGARVGIRDANYFSRIFKKVEGITPSQYRKSW